ncbi:class I SAM-dependent methyltransferase [Glycomyces salinus]|uniref:class I SAM-dependent methyltransferase n=1 Tax=Glycomyces salinus TaxID=980294 RepID=UPI0018ED16B2|nr:class I SAM-dependent methyltransferase [Glycomyces salinus]
MASDTAPSDGPPAAPSTHDEMARSFGRAADLYNASRPTYPDEALSWMCGDAPRDVADIGAGTGLLTRGLLALGHRVRAVEPDPQMLAKLLDSTPGLAGHHNAPAEDLPLPDSSVDVVTAGQAYHWFDRDRALPQFRRVLRPGGVFAPIWNVRDESVDWVGALSAIIGSSAGERAATGAAAPGNFAPHFEASELRVFRSGKTLDGPGLIALVQSRSVYITAGPDRRREITDAVADLLATHPQLAGRETFEMPYATHVFRARPA